MIRNKTKYFSKFSLLAINTFAIGGVFGDVAPSENGTLGKNSSASAEVKINIDDDQFFIGKLNEIDFDKFDSDMGTTLTENFCVYRSGSTPGFSYNLAITSDNTFAMKNSADAEIRYTVNYHTSSGGSGNTTNFDSPSNSNVTAAAITTLNGSAGVYSCGAENVSLTVALNQDDLSVAPIGDYSDVITLTISAPTGA